MSEGDSKPEGWAEALRRSGDSLLGLVQTRLELFAVELQEEKLRTIKLVIWLGVALALGGAGLLVAIGVLAIFLWETAGYLGLIGLAVATLAAAGGVAWFVRRQIQSAPPPFHTTVSEFKKDRECLHRNH